MFQSRGKVFFLVFIAFVLLAASAASAAPNPLDKRVIAHVSTQELKELSKKGCAPVKEIKTGFVLTCPNTIGFGALNVVEDELVYANDLNSAVQIKADAVWKLGFDGTGRTIAVIDSGIDYNHPELASSYAGGWDFVNNDGDPLDDYGHGTRVSGVITADGLTPSAKGVAPGAKIKAAKVLAADGSGFMSDVVQAIYWAADQRDVDVISMSIGVSESWKKRNCNKAYPDLDAAVDYAVSKGKVVVAAAGNNPDGVDAPACLQKVIAVGAVDSNNAIASFSSTGLAMRNHGLVAPGVGIYMPQIYGGYVSGSGTSYSAPHVSAVIALMKQKNPKMRPARVRQVLFSTATDLGVARADAVFGRGLVNALAAVTRAPAAGSRELIILLNGSEDDLNITLGKTVNATAFLEPPEGKLNCALNGTAMKNPFVWNPAPGDWNITCWVTASKKYAAAQSSAWIHASGPCGTLVADVKLNSSIYREGDTCFTIGADAVTIDCAGHAVSSDLTAGTYAVLNDGYDNTVVKNCVFFDYSYGANFSNANNSLFLNDTMYHSTVGVLSFGLGLFLYQSNYTAISSCNLSYNHFGLLAWDSSFLNVEFSSVSSNIYGGIALSPTVITEGNTIRNNTIYNNTDGVYAFGIDLSNQVNALVEYNNVSYGQTGVSLFNVNSSVFRFNTLAYQTGGAIGSALFIYGGANNNTFFGNNVSHNNGNATSFVFDGGVDERKHNVFVNEVYAGNTGNDVYSEAPGGYNRFLNCSLNKSNLYVFNGNFTVEWFVQANVTDAAGAPLAGVLVSVYDAGANLAASGFTQPDGLTQFFNLTEFEALPGGFVPKTPHNFTASLVGYAAAFQVQSIEKQETVHLVLTTE